MVGLATGVIGEQLNGCSKNRSVTDSGESGKAEDFAEAILTTDTCTRPVVTEEFGSRPGNDVGVAKGSGMIHRMATMLAFITCDANISSATLRLSVSM